MAKRKKENKRGKEKEQKKNESHRAIPFMYVATSECFSTYRKRSKRTRRGYVSFRTTRIYLAHPPGNWPHLCGTRYCQTGVYVIRLYRQLRTTKRKGWEKESEKDSLIELEENCIGKRPVVSKALFLSKDNDPLYLRV